MKSLSILINSFATKEVIRIKLQNRFQILQMIKDENGFDFGNILILR